MTPRHNCLWQVDFTNTTARAGLVTALVNQTKRLGLDGVNLDIERYNPNGTRLARDALTLFARELGSSLRNTIPQAAHHPLLTQP